MNKFTNKIAGKFKIFLPAALLILVAGIVLAAIFGMNTAPEYGSEKTLKIHGRARKRRGDGLRESVFG